MRRIAVAGPAALALIVSFTVWAGGTDSACTLDQVTNATGQVDTLTGVAPFGDGALVVGTRFAGSVGGAMEATATADGTYDAHQLDVFGGRVVQLDDVTTDGSQAWAVGSLSDLAPRPSAGTGRRGARWRSPTPVLARTVSRVSPPTDRASCGRSGVTRSARTTSR